jgi:hypothetical protein
MRTASGIGRGPSSSFSFESLPFDTLHDDEVLSVFGLGDFLDVADEGVLQ